MEAGGERYEYIPCLNAEQAHIEFLATLVREQLQGWLDTPVTAPEVTLEQALAKGATQ